MTNMDDTRRYAAALHHGQTDKAGMPYISHVERVHGHLIRLFPDASVDEQHAALLHDTIEDCGVTTTDLLARGYNTAVVAMVEAVSRPPDDKLTYAAWIGKLAALKNIGAIRIKIADLSDNSDPARLACLPPDKAKSLEKRYHQALKTLWDALHRHKAD